MNRSRMGGFILAFLVIVGIIGAMVAATILIATTNNLGRASQETAEGATQESHIEIDSAHVVVEDGRPVEVYLLIRHDMGATLDIRGLTVTLDTGQGVWLADATSAPVRDKDGSLAAGQMGLGDLIALTAPIDGPFPMHATHDVSIHAGAQQVGGQAMTWPAAQTGIVTAVIH